MIAPVSPLLLTSLKKSHCFSERNTPPCTNCVCNNLGYFGRFSYRQTILFLLLFPKVTHLWGCPKRYMRSTRFYSLRESKGALIDTLHMSSCALGRPQTPLPTSFVAKKKGTDYSVLLFSISKVYASLSSRALQVGFADP